MSKNFEEEYKKQMAVQAPDLWSRIETNLKEKTGTVEVEENKKKITRIYRKKYAVAACLGMLILAGGAFSIIKGNVGRQSNETMSDMAAAEWSQTDDSVTMTDETANAPLNGAAGEVAVPEDGYDGMYRQGANESERSFYLEDCLPGEDMEDAASDTDSDAGNGEDVAAAANEKNSMEVSEKGEERTSEEETLICQALVMITDIENTGEEIIFFGEVLPSVYSALEPGQIISFCVADLDIARPELGNTYDVTLKSIQEKEQTAVPYIAIQLEQK